LKIPTLSELRKSHERESGKLSLSARLGMLVSSAVLLWILFGFFAAPAIVRHKIEGSLAERLQRKISVGKVRCNPFILSLTVESFALAESDEKTLLGWQRFYVNFNLSSFVFQEWRLGNVELEGLSCHLAVAKDGRINFAEVFEQLGLYSRKNEPKKKHWPLFIGKLSVSEAQCDYEDLSRGETFASHVGPVTFNLKDFHTGGASQAPGEFNAATESGELVHWQGGFSLAPFRSVGDVEFSRVVLKKYAPYYRNHVHFDVLDGEASGVLHYEFAVEKGKPALRLSESKATLKSLKIAKRLPVPPVAAIDLVEISDLAVTWPNDSLDIGRLVFTGGSATIERSAEGLDLVSLFTPVGSETPVAVIAPNGSAAAKPLPKVKIGAISLRSLAITYEDHTTPRIARHSFTDVSCDLRNLSLSAPGTPLPFGFRAGLAPEGEVHVAGTLILSPLKAELGVELTNIALPDFSPYIEERFQARISKGKLNTALYLGAALVSGQPLSLSAQGDGTVDGFAMTDSTGADEIAGWRSLSIKGVEYSSTPSRLLVADVLITEPAVHLIVNQDGTINLSSALESKSEPVAVMLPSAPASPLTDSQVAIDRIALEKGSLDFADRSLEPNVRLSLNQLNGSVEGLSSSDVARAAVDLRGRIEGVAPLVITGRSNPFEPGAFTDLKMTVKALDLAPVAPYLGKFAGYELKKGTLTLDSRCRINRRKMEATNTVSIDQFDLGNATRSPAATKLPVRLAVALLKDTSGRIVLDIPVQGSIDDPNFHPGNLVLRVITNLLTKVATAPFALVSSLFGGAEGEDLSQVRFTTGNATPINEDELKKLDVVAKALRERPTLQLELTGLCDPVADSMPLREKSLDDQMRNIIWNDRRLVDPELTLEQVEVDPQQRKGMIRRLFYKAFPAERPRRHGGVEEDDSGPVTSQRGDLGAFRKKGPGTVAHEAPRPTPPKQEDAKLPEGTTETTANITEVKPATFDEMHQRLLALVKIDDEILLKLAADRANVVRDYLVEKGQVEAQRLTIVAAKESSAQTKTPRVTLRLK
jgi:outer membrane protein OmpA-like peptidoglycan-associated protein